MAVATTTAAFRASFILFTSGLEGLTEGPVPQVSAMVAIARNETLPHLSALQHPAICTELHEIRCLKSAPAPFARGRVGGRITGGGGGI